MVLVLSLLVYLFPYSQDASRNPEQFPRSFRRGVSEGIWWSFVSMTTVG